MEKNLKKIYLKIKNCSLCKISKNRKKIIFNKKLNIENKFIMIGESPGANEDTISGTLFSGKLGKYLNEFFDIIKLYRNKFYITNLFKYRPVKVYLKSKYSKYSNKKLNIKEINFCSNFLREEIKIFKSNLIISLVNNTFKYFLKKINLKDCHGKILKWKNKYIFPLYYPASIIYNKDLIKKYIQDMKNIKEYIEKI